MREAFRDILAAAPRMMRWWILVAPAVFLVGVLLYGMDAREAAALGVGLLPLGIAFVGLMWLHPVWGGAEVTWSRTGVAVIWAAVTLFPAVGISLLALLVVRKLFGVDP